MGMYTILMVVHTIVVLFLIGLILIQRTDSDGMGGLGGGGGNQFLTGRAAANLVTRTTAILAATFMTTSLILAVMANRITSHSIVDSVTVEAPAVVTKDGAEPAKDAAVKADVKSDAKAEDKAEKAAPEKKEKAKSNPSVPKPE